MDEQFTETPDPRVRAERHRQLARQYFYQAEKASSPFLRAAEEYGVRAQGELRVLEREAASGAGHTRP